MEVMGKLKTTEALDHLMKEHGVDITLATLINWCRNHGLGIQYGERGPWFVDKAKLDTFITEGTHKKGGGGHVVP